MAGVVLHAWLDRGRGDVDAARRALGAPAMQRAVRHRVTAQDPPLPVLPAGLPWSRPVARAGTLAVLALPPVGSGPSMPRRGSAALPRRWPAPPPRPADPGDPPAAVRPPALPGPTWARDLDTMRRLVAGLHRLK